MYKKILLKLSGEALYDDDNNHIISPSKLNFFIKEIKSIYDKGIKIGIVIGGGNIIRGSQGSELNLTRYKADNMGMLSTFINGIALEDCLNKNGVNSVMLSSIECNKICEFYNATKAIEYYENNRVLIFVGGIANPYFSTDTGAILRAMELGSDIVLKGTQVDGIYNKDPKKNTDAVLIEQITHDDFITKNLEVLDQTAVILAKKHNLPIAVFNIHKEDNLKNLLINGQKRSIILS